MYEEEDEDDGLGGAEEFAETTEQKLKRLSDRKEDLMTNLAALEQSLEALGYTISRSSTKSAQAAPQSGIRIKGALSFRGKQMAAEYFALLDEDGDGYLSWEDMRAMRSFSLESTSNPEGGSGLGLVHDPEFSNWESWQLYMSDAGIQTDALGRLEINSFIKYRELIEPRQPLARELELLKLGFLPKKMKLWSLTKSLIKEVLSFRSAARAEDDRGLNYEEVQYVLRNVGIAYKRPEFFRVMWERSMMEKLMESLHRRYLKRRYGNRELSTRFTKMLARGVIPTGALQVEMDDLKYVQASQLLAWLFASRPKVDKYTHSNIHNSNIHTNTNEHTHTHYTNTNTNTHTHTQTCLHTDTRKKKRSTSTACGGTTTNKQKPLSQKGYIYESMLCLKYAAFRFIRMVDSATRTMFNIAAQLRIRKVFEDFKGLSTFNAKQAEKSDFSFDLDVLGQGGNTEEGLGFEYSLQKVDHPETFLTRHKLPRELGSALIIELMLKSECSTAECEDAANAFCTFFKHHFDSEFKKNVQFRGFFVFPAVSEGDGAKVMRICIGYKRIVSIDAWFEQMLIPFTLNDIVTSISGAVKTSITLADLMSPSSSFQLDTMFTAHVEVLFQYRPYIVLNILKRLVLALSAGFTTHQVRPESEDANELMRRALREFYPSIISWSNYISSWVKGHKEVSLQFRFKTLSELLSRLGAGNLWFKQTFPETLSSEPGFLAKAYQRWVKYYTKSYMEVFAPLADFLENKAKKFEEEKRAALFRARMQADKVDPAAAKQAAVMDKLKRLGIEMDEDDVNAEGAADPRTLISTAEERLIRQDMSALATFEKCHNVLLGIHNVQFLCGKTNLKVAFSGVDFIELFPSPPSIIKVKSASDARQGKNKQIHKTETPSQE